ncbi:hypothetical protein TNMX_06765 [Thermus sp. NMX2.A1]|nr:hypothetical protein TNMX_06765 [Thermus sp. NMX2.A1]
MALRLDPLDEKVLKRLCGTPAQEEALRLRQRALEELGLKA